MSGGEGVDPMGRKETHILSLISEDKERDGDSLVFGFPKVSDTQQEQQSLGGSSLVWEILGLGFLRHTFFQPVKS